MRFILSVLLIAVLSFLAGFYFPWWSLAIAAFLVGLLIPLRIGFGFLAGFTAIFLFWGFLALWIDIKNKSILSAKMATIFPLGGSPALIILATAFVGALVGGFAAMAGSSLRSVANHRL